mgnify:CR=1 FL=1
MQAARDGRRLFSGGSPVRQRVHRVVGNQVEDGVPAVQQAHDALALGVAVVDAFAQRPLVLDRVAGGARIALAGLHQFVGRHAWRAGQQLFAQTGLGGVQRERERGPDPALRQGLEHARIAHGGEHQVLVADVADGAEQVDRFEHVVQVVRGLAHAHEHHPLHRPRRARQRHLGHDLGAAHLAHQATLPRHAEHAAHRATDLGGHAQSTARQQNTLDHLTIGQRHQQARRAVLPRVFGHQARQTGEFVGQRGQRRHQRGGQETGRLAAPAELRQGLRPQAQHALRVAGVGAERAQALVEVFDAHGGRSLAPHRVQRSNSAERAGPASSMK